MIDSCEMRLEFPRLKRSCTWPGDLRKQVFDVKYVLRCAWTLQCFDFSKVLASKGSATHGSGKSDSELNRNNFSVAQSQNTKCGAFLIFAVGNGTSMDSTSTHSDDRDLSP